MLLAWRQGDQAALEQLLPAVYDQLHAIAKLQLGRERRDHTLQPTALVNEAFLRLRNLCRIDWKDRSHFLAMSARVMRRVLVDAARARKYQKRGGGATRVTLDSDAVAVADNAVDLLELDLVLGELAAHDARKAQVVEMRFFGGLSTAEIAVALGISTDTVTRDWKLAKAWLLRELRTGTRAS